MLNIKFDNMDGLVLYAMMVLSANMKSFIETQKKMVSFNLFAFWILFSSSSSIFHVQYMRCHHPHPMNSLKFQLSIYEFISVGCKYNSWSRKIFNEKSQQNVFFFLSKENSFFICRNWKPFAQTLMFFSQQCVFNMFRSRRTQHNYLPFWRIITEMFQYGVEFIHR